MSIKPKMIPCAILLASCLLAACSDSQTTSSGSLDREGANEFSAADKQAAKVLSIGNEQALSESEGEGKLGETCSKAIADITEKLRLSGSLTNTQLDALMQAQAYYERQAAKTQAPPSDLPTPDGVEEDEADPTADPRVAIACLRRFQ